MLPLRLFLVDIKHTLTLKDDFGVFFVFFLGGGLEAVAMETRQPRL